MRRWCQMTYEKLSESKRFRRALKMVDMFKGGEGLKIIKRLVVIILGITVMASSTANALGIEVDLWDEYSKEFYGWVDDIYYHTNYRDKKAEVLGIRKDGNAVTVPSVLELKGEQYTVTAFRCTEYDSRQNFYEYIELPDTLHELYMDRGSYPKLKELHFPKNVEWFHLYIDYNKTKVTVPADHKYYFVKNHALYCKADPDRMHTTLDLPKHYVIAEGTTGIAGDFDHNKDVTRITFPSSWKEPYLECTKCMNLKSVDLSKTKIKTIGICSFRMCKSLQQVKFPPKLKTIGDCAFEECSVKEIHFPNRLKFIEWKAFYHCPKLKKVSLPKNMVRIGIGAFLGCNKLKEIRIACRKKAPNFKSYSLSRTALGLKFYVKNKKVAKSLKKNLKGSGVRKAKIYIGKKLLYKNVNG